MNRFYAFDFWVFFLVWGCLVHVQSPNDLNTFYGILSCVNVDLTSVLHDDSKLA
jgi:hypothetical protein